MRPWTDAGINYFQWPRACWHRLSMHSAYPLNGSTCRMHGRTGPSSIYMEAAISSAPVSPIEASSHKSPKPLVAVHYFPNTASRPNTNSPPACSTPAPPTGFFWPRAILPTASLLAVNHPEEVSPSRFCKPCAMKGCRCPQAQFFFPLGPICRGPGTVCTPAPAVTPGCVLREFQ